MTMQERDQAPRQSETTTREVTNALRTLGQTIDEPQIQGVQNFTYGLSRTSAEAVALTLSERQGHQVLDTRILTHISHAVPDDIKLSDELKIKKALESLKEAFGGSLTVEAQLNEKLGENTQVRITALEKEIKQSHKINTDHFIGTFLTPFER